MMLIWTVSKNKIIMEENRSKKILLMRITVTILAILILLIWIFNLKNVWRSERQSPITSDQESWVKLKTDLNKTLTDIQNQLNRINKASAPPAASSTDFLVNLLKNTKNSTSSLTVDATIATTTVMATTTFEVASSSPVNRQNNCPKYINCMPTIGSAPVCQIPVGCEGITALVY